MAANEEVIELPDNRDAECIKCARRVVTSLEGPHILCAKCIAEVRCVRHPKRGVQQDVEKWFAEKRFSRSVNDFVIYHYCPECRQKYEEGELI